MKRRTFLISGIATALGGAVFAIGTSNIEAAVVKVLHKRLDYLKLDAAGVALFAKDIVARRVVAEPKLRVLAAMGPLYTRFRGWGKLADVIAHGEERVVSDFLISSDFFLNGADETRVVSYLGYYDPLTRPCGNPFARLIEA